ncbi:MAG: tRNA preQ1(34) S-adenosylmethionine ribosyltransferase-isomerase QueA [Oscillospiraceae bacterium]|nr:tRNA preQ1(34) S-adenosylmethionine ribosyltransferase-isomerase QueA [Oscillospiraceae bacterium]
MLKSDFYYTLPEELIAQTPLEPRDSSRLMVLDRTKGTITHDVFSNIATYFNKGDLLVMNDSKVFPARLIGKKRGSAVDVEFLLLEQCESDNTVWETMVHPGRRLKKGATVDFPDSVNPQLSAEILETINVGNRLIRFKRGDDIYTTLDKIGNMPLPHYITEKLTDKDRYNTVYAEKTGSAAAPTAGLHFTDGVFESLAQKQIETAKITLHVGIGTFRPVKTDKIEEHKMHSERFVLPRETIDRIAQCKVRGNRVVAVGTTSCRTLEAFDTSGTTCGSTDIFITPGYRFGITDALLTNFHLPESTLLMLVSAFVGREATLAAYKEAIDNKYRFFSFGDSMLIL